MAAKEAMVSSLCWVLFLLCNCCSFVSSVNEEGIALLSFKQAIQQDPDGALSNWSSSDKNPCSWSGISCADSKVVSISIPESGLVGFVSPVLGSLSSLRRVNLRDNMLYGTLPTELFEASNLQSLILCGNSLSGSLPFSVGKLADLQTLDLSGNSFNGSIPTSILQCKRLKALDLGHNYFTGSLPVGFGSSLIMLEEMNLSYNQFTGSIPKDIGNLSSLKGTADLSHNHFSGPIPSSLGNLPEKVYIDLTYNNLSGPIPQSGALVNRGPTAFIGNPGLCGPPLRNLCTNSSIPATLPYLPASATYSSPTADVKSMVEGNKSRSLKRSTVIAIVVGDVIGISLVGLVLFYYYWKVVPCSSEVEGGGLERRKEENECLCFRKEESEAPSETVERFGFVPLDLQVDFDIDRLLKSSAYVLGKSGIGIVYKVVLEDGVTLAVRRLGEGGLQGSKEFRMEIEAIGRLRHPSIVTLRAYYWSQDEKLLIYDYIPNGDLAAAIHGNAGTSSFSPMPWPVRLKIMKGIAEGLVYIHEFSPKKYVHGNLKPNNILLGLNMEPYISDFGLGRLTNITGGFSSQSTLMAADTQLSQPSDVSATLVGNPGSFYQAPEAPKLRKPSQKWDVYSYGVILLEMITGRSPIVLVGASEMDLVRWVRLNIDEKKPLLDVFDPFLAQGPEKKEEMIAVLKIALACVQTNAERRPHMRQVLEALDRLAPSN